MPKAHTSVLTRSLENGESGTTAIVKNRLVKLANGSGNEGKCVYTSASTDRPYGATDTKSVDPGYQVDIVTMGEVYLETAGAIALAAVVMPNSSADGRILTHAGSNHAVGEAMEAASAAGAIIRVRLFNN